MMTMMSRTITLLAAIVMIAASVSAQSSKAETELRSLLNQFLEGAGRNDAAIHDRFWAKDLIYTRSAGARINKEELMKSVRSAPGPKPEDPVTVYSAEDMQIHIYGTTAVVAFKLIGKTSKTDGSTTVLEYLNTGTFVRRKGQWQAVAWQATAIPNPAAQTAAESKPAEQPSEGKPANLAGRTYLRGPKGGCYYVNASGKKSYVKKELCN